MPNKLDEYVIEKPKNRLDEFVEEPDFISKITQGLAGLPEDILSLETINKLPGIIKYPILAGRGLTDIVAGVPEFARGLIAEEAKPGVFGIPFAPSFEKGKKFREIAIEAGKGIKRTFTEPKKTLEEEPATFVQTPLLIFGGIKGAKAFRPKPKFVGLPKAEAPVPVEPIAGEGFTVSPGGVPLKAEIAQARAGVIPPYAVEFRPKTIAEAEQIKAPESPLAVNQKVLGKQPQVTQEALPFGRVEPSPALPEVMPGKPPGALKPKIQAGQYEFAGLQESFNRADPPQVLFKDLKTGKVGVNENIKFEQVSNPDQLTQALAEVRGKAQGVPGDFNFIEWDLDKTLSNLTGALSLEEISKRAAAISKPPGLPPTKPVALLPAPAGPTRYGFKKPLFGEVHAIHKVLDPPAVMKHIKMWNIPVVKDYILGPSEAKLAIQKFNDRIIDIQKEYKELRSPKSFKKIADWLKLKIPDDQLSPAQLKAGRGMLRVFEIARPDINRWRAEKGLSRVDTSKGYFPQIHEWLVDAFNKDSHPVPQALFDFLEKGLPTEKFFGSVFHKSRIPSLLEDPFLSYQVFVKGWQTKLMAERVVPPFKEFIQKYQEEIPHNTQQYFKEFGRREIFDRPSGTDLAIDPLIEKYVNPLLAQLQSKQIELPPDLARIFETKVWEMPRFQIGPRAASRLIETYRRYNYMALIGANLKTMIFNMTLQPIASLARLRGWPTQTIPDFMRGKMKAIAEIFDGKKWEKYAEEGLLQDFAELYFSQSRHRFLGDELMRLTMWNMKYSEFMNRLGDAYAGKNNYLRWKKGELKLDTESWNLKKGVFEQEAQHWGSALATDTNFPYGPSFRPPYLLNPLGRLVMQYNTFALKHGQVLWSMFKDLKMKTLLPDFYKAVREGNGAKFLKELATEDRGSLLRYIGYGSAVVTAFWMAGTQMADYFTRGPVPIFEPPGIQFASHGIKVISHILDGHTDRLEQDLDKLEEDLRKLIPTYIQTKRTIGAFEALTTGEITQKKGPLGLTPGRVQYKVEPGLPSALGYGLFGAGEKQVAEQQEQIQREAKRAREYRDLREQLTDAWVEGDTDEFRKLFQQIFDEYGVIVDVKDVMRAAEGRKKTKLERVLGTLPKGAR